MQLLRHRKAEHAEVAEELLVRRASRGDTGAFADLYERHLDRMFRYFYYRLGHREDAEDLTEQVFMKAWQAISDYDHRGAPFAAWLFRVAHNTLIDRRRGHREAVPLDDDLDIEDGGTRPDEIVARRLEARELASALARLSDVEQTTIILRFIEGLDHRTVAGIIGKTEVATRAIQSRALGRMALLLGAQEGRTR